MILFGKEAERHNCESVYPIEVINTFLSDE